MRKAGGQAWDKGVGLDRTERQPSGFKSCSLPSAVFGVWYSVVYYSHSACVRGWNRR